MENSNYNHTNIENEIYNYWEKNNFFKPRKNKKKVSWFKLQSSVAQLVEQLTVNQLVAGSSPARGAN